MMGKVNRKLLVLLAVLVAALVAWNLLVPLLPKQPLRPSPEKEKVRVVSEESVVIEIIEKISPSVVTVGIEERLSEINPFDPFDVFRRRGTKREQDIGSGFIVSSDGLIVTNRHVVQGQAKYKVITDDGKKYDVVKIYRDPVNDIAILKVNPSAGSGQVLKPVEMGDSLTLKVGQIVVAVGTPLGQFRGSATKGIISGLGRGITAGSPLEGYVEKLDDVIQTDAAINPGNSGGPLVNSSGQVIGVNTAIVTGAENIGFAIPIRVVKETLDNFNKTGQFSRPYLGVVYQIVSRELSLLNEIPEGAFVREVVHGTPAQQAGMKEGDIITKVDGQKVTVETGGLASIISKKRVGDTIKVTLWRDGATREVTATLQESPGE